MEDDLARLRAQRGAFKRAEEKKRSLLNSITTVTLVTSLFGAVTVFVQLRTERPKVAERERLAEQIIQERQKAEALQTRARVLEAEKNDLRRLIVQLQQKSGLENIDDARLSSNEKMISDLSQRMGALETAIVQTPEKAVSLPLIRQQLVDVQDRNKGDVDAIHGEIGRLYGFMQWLLGLIVTLIVGIGGLAINSFRQSADKGKRQEPGPDDRTVQSLGTGKA